MEYIIIDDLTKKTVYTTDSKHRAKAVQEVLIDRYGRAFFVCVSDLNPTDAIQQEAGELRLQDAPF